MNLEIACILRTRNSYVRFKQLVSNPQAYPDLIPEVDAMRNQRQDRYHDKTVLDHALATLEFMETTYGSDQPDLPPGAQSYLRKQTENFTRWEILKLAAFLHDIGKPQARSVRENGTLCFHGHDLIGSRLVRHIGQRFGLTPQERSILARLVRHHMWPLHLYVLQAAVPDACACITSTVGKEWPGLILLSLADVGATLGPEKRLLFEDFSSYLVAVAGRIHSA